MIKERIKALRREMDQRNIDIYLIPTSDYHESEYVGEYFKTRKYMTGFTGSAGTVVITREEAGLWTDGRYFIQAQQQLKDTSVTLYKSGEEGVPTIIEFIKEKLPKGGCLSFDGRVINGTLGEELGKLASQKEGSLSVTEDLVDIIWKDRQQLPQNPVYILEECYAGENIQSKMTRLREQMKENKANIHILTSLYDIAWLLNIRGDDIPHVPVVLSYVVITEEECTFYVQKECLNDEVKTYLKNNQINIKDYEEIYHYVTQIEKDTPILLDKSIVNYRIITSLEKAKLINKSNPTELMRSIKNETELNNIKEAHIKDGVAFTKFMYWLKTQIKNRDDITELIASDYLEERRKEQTHFVDLSFDTICAYESNGAMMHYSAKKESCALLKPEGFLLVDSGGHYLEGSTDITRTIALGRLSEEQKLHFTAVLRSNLNLANAKFLHGCRGTNLDILARGPIWEMGLDYKCGTGHGIGYLLNVHEGPNGFRWKIVEERNDSGVLEEGMVTTNEPGVYLEGKYGIRTENELICRKGEKNEYGQFMYFETITYAPIDLDAVIPEKMSQAERTLLNNYHFMVYKKIAPHLKEEEREWLKEYTKEI